MKFFKLVFAELRKIVLKPSIFVLVGFLIGALSINGFMYNPKINQSNKSSITGVSVTEVRNKFNGSGGGSYSKNNVDSSFNNESTGAKAFVIYANTDNKETKNNLLALVENIRLSYENFGTEIESQTTENLKAKVEKINQDLNTLNNTVTSELSSIVAKVVMSNKDYNYFQQIVNNFNTSLSVTKYSTEEEYYRLYQIINARKYISNLKESIQKIEVVSFKEDVSKFISTTYENAIEKLNEQYEIISNYEDSTLANVINNFNVEITKYSEIAKQAKTIIQSTYQLNISTTLNKYKNYENFNAYQTKYDLTENKFLFNNSLYSFQIAQVFNTNSTSNNSTATCFDFFYNTMLVVTLIVIIYSIILATSSVASEYSTGSIKLLLIRPYSRRKILTAKIVATIMFSAFFIILSAIVSFIIGSILFPSVAALNPMLVVISSSTAFLINPIALSLIFLLTTLIKCSIYILISILISSLFRNPIASIVVALSFYFAGLICNLFISTYAWAMILPFPNFDLFNYFLPISSSTQIGNLFTGNYTLSNIIISVIYDIILTTILTIPSYYIFRHNDI